MKKIHKLLTIACVLFCSAIIAQPVMGTTDFAVNGTISWNTNSPCVATKTADVQGWLVSINSTSNCGINQSNSGSLPDSDGRMQYLVGFGTLTQASFGTDDGSEFALTRLAWSVSTPSFVNVPIQFIGYRNGMPVPGATLTANTPPNYFTSTSNSTIVTFTNNLNFANVDNVIMIPTMTCSSILAFEDITIGQPSVCVVSPTVTLNGTTNNICNGGAIGGATVSASGGAPFTYSWSPSGGTAASISGRTSGIYTVVVTNSCSISSALTVTITQPSAVGTATGVTNVLCFGGSNGSATVAANGGVGGYTYLWSNGATATTISGLLAGAYTATVTDANGCKSSRAATVTQPSALVTTTAVTNVACNGGSNGVASITASGGVGGYTYLWSTGNTTSAITGKMAGAYTATVTDANSCTSIKSANITQPSALVTSTAVTNALCNGTLGSATVTASGGTGAYSYTWSSGPTTSVEPTLLAGTYTVKVTDANSCNLTKSVTITQPSALVTSTAVTNVACNGGSNGVASITASGGVGGYTYLWSSGNTTSAITGKMAGAYTATVTDANSCTSIKSAVITQPSALVTTTAVTNVACNGGSNGVASITPSGGAGAYTYLWSNGATTSAITGLLQGVYTATVTDANSCTSIKSANVTQPSALVTTTAVTTIACNGGSNGSATITASGGVGSYTYLWSNGATTPAISGLLQGVYTATVTDANSCTSIKSANVTEPTALVTTTAITTIACNGGSNGSATITASGGVGSYTYLWSNGATTPAISGLLQGVYTATVTDANSCTSIKSANVTEPTALVTTTAVTNVSCNSGSNGSATITASGGAVGYTYLWSNGATTPAISGLLQGVYTATVTDANSCISIKSANITQPTALVTSTDVTNVSCNSGSNGSATITASGGAVGYTYLWSNGATTSAITGLLQGVYTATVTDANSCTSIKSANVTEPTALVTTTAVTNVACNGGSNGVASITASGGAGSYTYLWSNGATTSTITGLLASAYTATVTDANSCTNIKSAIITQPSAIVTTTSTTNVLCNGGSNGSSTITATGGTGSYTYLWSNGATTSVISGLMQGVYSATVTDANSCTNSSVITVTQPSALTLTVTATNATICAGSTTTLTATANGGTGAITYSWVTGPATTNYAVSPVASTVYSVNISDANSCTRSETLALVVLNVPTITVNDETICTGNSATIIPGGADTYTISGGSFIVSPIVNTTYSVTGTAVNGCTGNTAVSTISVNVTPTVTVNNETICSNNSAVITPSGSSNYTISGGSFTVSPNTTTSYTVTGTTNGCVSANAVSTISVNTTPTITLNSGAICPGNSYTLEATGADTYTYSSGTAIVSPAVTTTYSAIGTGTNGCPAFNTATATVSVVNTLTISVSGATNVCSGKSTTLTASGASTYSWSTGITTNTIALSPTANTSYTVYGTSGTCSNTAVVSLSVLTTPTVTANSATICSGASVTLTPSGANTYTVTGNNFTVTPSATTSYTVAGTATNGCLSNNAVSTVSVNTTPTLSVNSGSICEGNSMVITPTGANTYTINGGIFTVSPSTNTTYSVTGTSTNGCVSANAISSVTVYALPTISVNSGAVCTGDSFTLVPAGAATYSFSNGSDVIANPVATADYSVTGTSAQGCPASNTAVATVSVVNTLTITVTGNTTICTGQTATLTANGANTYSWSTGDQTATVEYTPTATTDYTVLGTSGTCSNTAVVTVAINSLPTITVNSGQTCEGSPFVITPTGADTYSITGNTFTVTPTATENFTVTGTDLNGCVSTEVVSTVTVNALPLVTASASNATVCVNATTSLTADGAITYSWSTSQADAIIAITATVAGSETYTVWGTDANGCVGTATVTQITEECLGVNTLNRSVIIARVYPNPNTGSFMVETNENAHITVINSVGQAVYSQATTGTKTNVSITHLANGIYFVKIIANGNQQVIKVIKE